MKTWSRTIFQIMSIKRIRAIIGPSLVLFLILNSLGTNAQQQSQPRLLQQPEQVRAWPSKAKRWALVIGVDQYDDGNISPLRGAANDARTLARVLVENAGFPGDQVILLATDQPRERRPTRINILAYLSNLASMIPKDGLLLVSFAGHGIERGGQAYLIPADARYTEDVSLLEESAVSVTRMHNRIRATGASQVVILLDACRNDPGGRADAPNPLTTAYTSAFNFDVRNREVEAFATIYATAVGQRAYEYAGKKQGYFTWAVVEALRGAAANAKGEVTLASLVQYVQESVPRRIAIDLGSAKKQYPFAIIEGYRADDLVMAVAVARSKEAMSPTRKIEVPTKPMNPDSEFWNSIKDSNQPDDFIAYRKAFPRGRFLAIANNKLRQLRAARTSAEKSKRADLPADDATEPLLRPLPSPTPSPTRQQTRRRNPGSSGPEFSIKQIGSEEWRVIVPAGQWHDTGIPVIVNHTVVAIRNSGGKWILKLGGKSFWPGVPAGGGYYLNNFQVCETGCELTVDPDFTDTIKLKVDDEGGMTWVSVKISVSWRYPCDNRDAYHLALHRKAEQWFQAQKAKVERQ
jgi:hypothetical protein